LNEVRELMKFLALLGMTLVVLGTTFVASGEFRRRAEGQRSKIFRNSYAGVASS
jgi:hypothetical protein